MCTLTGASRCGTSSWRKTGRRGSCIEPAWKQSVRGASPTEPMCLVVPLAGLGERRGKTSGEEMMQEQRPTLHQQGEKETELKMVPHYIRMGNSSFQTTLMGLVATVVPWKVQQWQRPSREPRLRSGLCSRRGWMECSEVSLAPLYRWGTRDRQREVCQAGQLPDLGHSNGASRNRGRGNIRDGGSLPPSHRGRSWGDQGTQPPPPLEPLAVGSRQGTQGATGPSLTRGLALPGVPMQKPRARFRNEAPRMRQAGSLACRVMPLVVYRV